MGLGLSIVNSAKKPPRSGSTGCYAKVGGVELQPLCPMGFVQSLEFGLCAVHAVFSGIKKVISEYLSTNLLTGWNFLQWNYVDIQQNIIYMSNVNRA